MKINRADKLSVKPVKGSIECDLASTYIKQAIDELGQVAKDSIIAREAIANLSVVLLDLQEK